MNLRERREARREAQDEFLRLVQDEGLSPKQAKAELNKWGKEKFGAPDWKAIFALLLPILLKWLGL